MRDDYAIVLDHVGKRYTIRSQKKLSKHTTFSVHTAVLPDFFWALKDITVNIPAGTIVGVVGRNGAGKTTLLHIIAGTLAVSEGAVSVAGRTGCILSLGAGFQNELSGRENIYLNASLLGIEAKDVIRIYRDIVAFSELNEFIELPLGTYSQGMRLRLGFSIAVHVPFDVYVIDEVLTVGDGAFQQKCFKKLTELKYAGKTMVITSQDLNLIERLSDEVILLEQGRCAARGNPATVIDEYRNVVNNGLGLRLVPDEQLRTATKWRAEDKEEWGTKEGTGEAAITKVRFLNRWGREIESLKPCERLTVHVDITVNEEIANPHFGIALFRDDGVYCYGPNTSFDGYQYKKLTRGKGFIRLTYPHFSMKPGMYYFSVALWDEKEVVAYDYHKGCYALCVHGENEDGALAVFPVNVQRVSVFAAFKERIFRKQFASPFVLLHDRWQTKQGTEALSIGSVTCADIQGIIKDTFFTGETMVITVEYARSHQITSEICCCIALYREDRILCISHTAAVFPSETSIIVMFPSLNLLPGRYRISAGIVDMTSGTCSAYSHGLHSFSMVYDKRDHGTIYLEHSWDVRINQKSII